jgi:preprotein translocase subunit YajC
MTPLFAFLFQQVGGSGMASLLMMAAIFGVFYFLLIMPQQKRQKKWQAMLGELKAGDKVTTSGGLMGTILSVKGTEAGEAGSFILRLPPDNIKVEVTRNSIVSVRTEDAKA